MLRRFVRSEYFPLVLTVTAGLCLAAVTLPSYGESWDEYNFFLYAKESLSAYANLGNPDFVLSFQDPTLRYYGPWFLMLTTLASRVFPQSISSDVAHLLTFLFFQVGVVFFYLLARRWLKPLPSLGATLLFASQPVLWGHAFINARDIPFMVGFIVTIYFGLRMNDSLSKSGQVGSRAKPEPLSPLLRQDTANWTLPMRILLPIGLVAGMAAFVWLSLSLSAGWQSAAILNVDTTSARELDLYLHPLLARFWSAVICVGLGLIWAGILFLPFLPRSRARLWDVELRPIFRSFAGYGRNPSFWAAALSLGLTIATRILGVAAGGLVILFLLFNLRRRAYLAVMAYIAIALIIIYVAWPYLWGEPLLRLLITLRIMLRFPWPGQVLFDGVLYAGNELPRTYILKLLAFQLTEPVLILVVLALGVLFWKIYRKKTHVELALLTGLWFGLPVTAAIVGHSYLYDNFRQLLFALPPLFLWTGVALEWVFTFISKRLAQVALLIALALPGIWGAAQLHPYEYIYYNTFTGGVSGAQGRYELDYWGTSMRAMAAWTNDHLPQGAAVVVWGPSSPFWRYSRPDLKIYDSRDPLHPARDFYAVILRRAEAELTVYPDLPELYVVSIRDVPLSALKYIGP